MLSPSEEEKIFLWFPRDAGAVGLMFSLRAYAFFLFLPSSVSVSVVVYIQLTRA